MKIKTILLIIVQTFFFTALSAQTTQEQADKIVLERMSSETQSYTVYAKEDVQPEMTITTSAGEELELDYPCWVYYVSYADTNQGRYIIVNEANGNLLEVDAKSGAEPENLAEWREIYCHNENYSIEHVKTELDALFCDKGILSCGEDTVIITVSKDSIDVFVGIGSIPNKSKPFETEVEIIDDVLYMRIIDKCDETIDPSGCYSRAIPYPYYTFDFVFKYQGEVKQKYKILLRYIHIFLGDWPVYDSTTILSEGIINSKNR